jgi:hypothetical protein
MTISEILKCVTDSASRDALEEAIRVGAPLGRALGWCVQPKPQSETYRLIAIDVAMELTYAASREDFLLALSSAERNGVLSQDVIDAVRRCL